MIYKIRHIDDNVYTLTYYDKNYKSITATFINDILQGNHITKFINRENVKYYKFNKKVNKFNYGNIKTISFQS